MKLPVVQPGWLKFNLLITAGTPRIIHPPRDTEVSPGGLMRLSCLATGYPQPNVEWTHDGRQLRPNDNLEILSNGELIIRNLHQNHQGIYRCTALNQHGVAHASANVFVKSKKKSNSI